MHWVLSRWRLPDFLQSASSPGVPCQTRPTVHLGPCGHVVTHAPALIRTVRARLPAWKLAATRVARRRVRATDLTVGTAKDASVPTPSILYGKAASLPATVVTAPSANSCARADITIIARAGSSSRQALLEPRMLLRDRVALIAVCV